MTHTRVGKRYKGVNTCMSNLLSRIFGGVQVKLDFRVEFHLNDKLYQRELESNHVYRESSNNRKIDTLTFYLKNGYTSCRIKIGTLHVLITGQFIKVIWERKNYKE
jgi:hypothetical protein